MLNKIRFNFKISKSNKYAACLSALFLCLSLPLHADSLYFDNLKQNKVSSHPLVEWKHVGPGMSGYIDKFWLHPTDPNAMFMDLDMGNQHGTWDHGNKWQSIRDSDGTDADRTGLTVMAFSYQDPDFGLFLAKDGVYKSNDRGRTWQFLVDSDPDNSNKHNIMSVDPTDDNIWYIGAGQSWMIKMTHFDKDGIVYDSTPNHSKGYILKSDDKGLTWKKKTTGLAADSDFSAVIVDPRNNSNVYASSQHGVFKSNDAGESWTQVTGNGLPHQMPRDMDSYYNAQTGEFYLYLLEATHYTPDGSGINTTGGVYRSDDGGTTWDNLTGNLGIDLNEINSWGYLEKYWRTIASWNQISIADAKSLYPNLPSNTFSQFIGIEVDPTNKDRIYLVHNNKHDYGFPPGNIWMTSDAGEHWIAAAREGLYWSNEVDKSYWESRNQPLGMNSQFAHVHREHAESDNVNTGPRFVEVNNLGEVYTAFAQQVMRSTDNGATWNQIDDYETSPGSGHWVGSGDSNLPGETIQVNTGKAGSILFGSGEHGLWRNTDDGELVYPGAIAVEQLTGQSIAADSPTSIGAITVAPNDPNKIYTLQFRQSKKGELWHSADNGKTWSSLSTPITFVAANDVIKHYSLLIDHQQPENFYFTIPSSVLDHHTGTMWKANGPSSFDKYGIYRSTDGGINWEIGASGIPSDKSIYRLAMDPSNAQIIYAAANQTVNSNGSTIVANGGLYKSINGGDSWQAMTLPANIDSVNGVVPHSDGVLYIATGSTSTNSDIAGAWKSLDGGDTWQSLFDMPYVRSISPSPIDPNVIAVIAGPSKQIGRLNPGAYFSTDGGLNWDKANHNHGQAGRIANLEADPNDLTTYWASLYGTGFWKVDLSALLMQIPGTIEAEHYDLFADNTPNNQGGAYRYDDVDIINSQDTGGGYAVSDTENNEALYYTINATKAGSYAIEARVASNSDDNRFKYSIDDLKVGKDVAFDSTGGLQQWTTISTEIGELSKGIHQLKIYFNSGDIALNSLKFIESEVISKPDFDKDGITDDIDTDDDNDGVKDSDDAFPLDPTESIDSDSDGTGNNADLDDDGDKVNDSDDAFPLDPTESIDSDKDGTGNNADLDDDGDKVNDSDDAFPLDPTESIDSDSDGTGNNADLDDDGDKVNDSDDAFPLDPTESIDSDKDGTGNNADLDDDNDGVNDSDDAFPLDPTKSSDDSIDDNPDLGDDTDSNNSKSGGSLNITLLFLLLSLIYLRRFINLRK